MTNLNSVSAKQMEDATRVLLMLGILAYGALKGLEAIGRFAGQKAAPAVGTFMVRVAENYPPVKLSKPDQPASA